MSGIIDGKVENWYKKKYPKGLPSLGFVDVEHPPSYIKEIFKEGYQKALKEELESFKDWCHRVKEENPNAPWEDETVESMYKIYRKEKTGLNY